MGALRINRIFVVSGSGSAADELDRNPSRDPVPASAAAVKKSRRLQCSLCRFLKVNPLRVSVIRVRDEHEPRSRIYAFNAFFSSRKNRQSVPCATIFCGLNLIISAS